MSQRYCIVSKPLVNGASTYRCLDHDVVFYLPPRVTPSRQKGCYLCVQERDEEIDALRTSVAAKRAALAEGERIHRSRVVGRFDYRWLPRPVMPLDPESMTTDVGIDTSLHVLTCGCGRRYQASFWAGCLFCHGGQRVGGGDVPKGASSAMGLSPRPSRRAKAPPPDVWEQIEIDLGGDFLDPGEE